MDEIVADGCEKMLENTDIFNKLAQKDASVAKEVANHIKSFLKSLFDGITKQHHESKVAEKYIKEMQSIWDDALEDALTSEGEGAGEFNSNGESHKSVADINGFKYVQADRQVFYGNDSESWGEQITRYINSKIRNGADVIIPTLNGENIKITSDSAEKAAFRNDVKVDNRYRKMTDDEYETKLNAEAHIDELVQISQRGKKNVPDEKSRHGDKAANGFNYRTAFFRDFDGSYYKLTISVMEGVDGKITYNIGKIEERSFPKISGSSANAAPGKTSSDRSISPEADKSKRKSVADAEYIDAVNSDDMETAQRMVDEAAKAAGYTLKAYHGTPNGTFTEFKGWQYFTTNKEYADVYQNQGASSNGYKRTANNPKTYEVYLNTGKVFDTRKVKERRIFQNEFFGKWGNGTPLSNRFTVQIISE